MPKRFVGFKIEEEELQTLERIKEARGFSSLTEAFRDLIRLANVLFDDRLTVKKAIKPSMWRMILTSESFAENVPLMDILRTVPQMEKAIEEDEEK